MVTMSFGDHIEELRARLILALLGLMVGVVVTFIPPLNLGKRIMTKMEEPAQGALKAFYADRAGSAPRRPRRPRRRPPSSGRSSPPRRSSPS